MCLSQRSFLSLLELASALTALTADKTQCSVHLSFNSTLQLIKYISSNLQKVPSYFNGTVVFVFLKIPFDPSATVFPKNLAPIIERLQRINVQYQHQISVLKLVTFF